MKDKLKLIAILITLIVTVSLAGYLFIEQSAASAPETKEVANVFVDVNGDGMLDVILEGTVIFNDSPLALDQP